MSHSIFVIDDQHPEDVAMLQALYSRSPASVVDHLDKLRQSGSGKFMENYYVGYGHASIGDCGSTTCFIEQVSMLVAKAVQDTPLYNGQEASTRYLDFSKQRVVDPYNHPASAAIQSRWMDIYNATLPLLQKGLEARHPFDPARYRSEKIWQNAIKARSFDIARSLLPVGTTTLLSWTTTLRHARDHLRKLKHHPLPEVRAVAQSLFKSLYERYPHSFKANDMAMDAPTPRDIYAQAMASRTHYLSPDEALRRFALSPAERQTLDQGGLVARRDTLDLAGLKTFESATLADRPSGAALPWHLESYGQYNLLFLLDFGSFRDIQRHRNGVCPIPLIGPRFGLHPWYMDSFASLMAPDDAACLKQAIAAQYEAIAALPAQGVTGHSAELDQYLYPMGARVLVQVSYSVPQMAYVGELRSGKTVHPTLRPVAQAMLDALARDLPNIALHGDHDADDWTAKRGEQTIEAKPNAA